MNINWNWCDTAVGFIVGFIWCIIVILIGIWLGEHKN